MTVKPAKSVVYRCPSQLCPVLKYPFVKMMMYIPMFLVLATAALVKCQRPFFAGNKPIGYPEIATTEGLEDRFGEVDGTTQRLPIEANGDRDLIDRLSKLPLDKQPFWFINWQALEAHRQNPQTYPQKPNVFSESPKKPATFNAGNTASANSGITGSSIGNLNSGSSFSAASSNVNTPNPTIANRISETATTKPITANRKPVGSNSGNRKSVAQTTTSKAPVLAQRFGGIELNNFDPTIHDVYTNLGSGTSS